jgi:hypothetical protein
MIFRISDLVEGYRLQALHSRDVHELAGRRDRIDITRFMGDRVLSELALGPEDDLVDIGCGDGYLIRSAKVRSALGLTATEEEAERLRNLGLEVRQGLTHALPVADAAASAVCCNGVLFLTPPQNWGQSGRNGEDYPARRESVDWRDAQRGRKHRHSSPR